MSSSRSSLPTKSSPLSLLFGTRLYAVMLGRARNVTALKTVPNDQWPGDAAHGADIVGGEFRFGDLAIARGASPWGAAPGIEPGWLFDLHRFAWLRDLRALNGASGGADARRIARALVGDWIERHQNWSALSWAPTILGPRLANWIGCHDFFLASADGGYRRRVFASITRQARHLARALPLASGAPSEIIGAIKGLVFAGATLPDGHKLLARGLSQLETALARQVLADGGHIERNPTVHVSVLRDLVDMRALVRNAGEAVPDSLQNAIDRMAPALRYFLHGDGRLALFNGSTEGDAAEIAQLLQLADVRGKPVRSAIHSGFQRVLADRTLLVADVGGPPPRAASARAHAGTLAFEMSVGKHRLIVNCGTHVGYGEAAQSWRQGLRGTAAHSTLSLDGQDTLPLAPIGFRAYPPTGRAKRMESESDVLIEAHHEFYGPRFGHTHVRRLYMAEGGDDVRGEDCLLGPDGVPLALRFHLHPAVQASMLPDGYSVLLRLPGGQGWRMRANLPLQIEESVYFADGLTRRGSEQVVVHGVTEPRQTVIKWAIFREGRGPARKPDTDPQS